MTNPTKPQCLGFIMDGNRRWATSQGLPTLAGHQRGGEVLRDCIAWLAEQQIPHGVFYAFSTENWQRSAEEVGYLLDLFREALGQFDQSVRVRFIGQRDSFPADLVQEMHRLEQATAATPGTTIWIALSYGGRAEIVAAANQAIERGQRVTEATFAELLWTAELPDPDLIVRTGGEQRLSNFLTWRSVYSELYIMPQHWPALTRTDFDDILVEYERRTRRHGT